MYTYVCVSGVKNVTFSENLRAYLMDDPKAACLSFHHIKKALQTVDDYASKS